MSLDAQQQIDSPWDAQGCPGCIERDKEIRRLQEELAAFRGESTKPRGFGWWCLLALGLCVLALSPHMAILSFTLLAELGADPWMSAAQGVVYGVVVSQYAVVGLIVALHWRPRWQRLVGGVVVAGFFGLVTAVPYFSSSESLFYALAPVVPTAIVISTCPSLIQRALFRWTIAFRGQSIPPSPLTLSSYFALVGLCGLALGCLRLTDSSFFGQDSRGVLVAIFLMYVGVPAATTGCLFAVLLPTILQRGPRPWITRALRLIATIVVTAAGPLVLCLVIWALGSDDLPLEKDTLLYVSSHCIGVAAIAIVVAVATFLWMRLLGYQLLSTPRTLIRRK